MPSRNISFVEMPKNKRLLLYTNYVIFPSLWKRFDANMWIDQKLIIGLYPVISDDGSEKPMANPCDGNDVENRENRSKETNESVRKYGK